MNFFNTLDPVLKTLWFIALPASLIFIIQGIMTFVGVDATDGLDADFDSDLSDGDSTFQLFTFRNLINFLLGFSWTGISFYQLIDNKLILGLLSFGIGAAFVVGFFVIIRQIEKLAEDNTFTISKALNKTGAVYLTIPARKSGTGKVQVSVNGAFHELDAITEQGRIETSTLVRIVGIEDNNLVVVERI